MVGDPSGKSAERNLLDEEALRHNLEGQRKQLEKFLDFNCGANSAVVVNNYDWMKEFSFLGFLRDVGKHITISYMMAKDSVQTRLEKGISFTEFSYQLIQGYDFYYLWKHHGVQLQMGGSDQWGNITTGNELIRRMEGGDAFALCTNLIKKADGTKFGKTEGGNIWLDPARTSPYKFYQFWLNASDEDATTYIKIFSMDSREVIESLIEKHAAAPHERMLQKALAEEVTQRVHSEGDLKKAQAVSNILFGKSTGDDLRQLDDATILDVFEGVPQFQINREQLHAGLEAGFLLTEATQIMPSKSEMRRALKEGSLSLNKEKISGEDQLISSDALIGNRYLLVQRGKKNYFLIIAA